jgi:hypothetical protein
MATEEIEYNAFYHTLQVLWLYHVARMRTQAKAFKMNVRRVTTTSYFTE